MQQTTDFDAAIVGGGLAGLASAILLAKENIRVALFEKEKYPFHKVCGEYVSMESWKFLEGLGLPLLQMQLPVINSLFLSAPNGKSFSTKLPLGGFGISRYLLDSLLADIAMQNGVHLFTETKVQDISNENYFQLSVDSKDGKNQITAKVCCGSYGKRSNLDVKLNRAFLSATNKRLHNYIGVKYHIKTQWKENVIGLHNFKNGYCGISKIEEDKFCLCYMTTAQNLKTCNSNIEQMQKTILCRNPHLKKIFAESEFCKEFPITISQISFQPKTPVENGMLMLGDAAGMITPLCGNGMSIALHTGKLAATSISSFLKGINNKSQMENGYAGQWNRHFSRRLKTGRTLQHFFGSERLSNAFVSLFRTFPFLANPVVKMTHGKPF